MKKQWLILLFAALVLVACGAEENSSNTTNTPTTETVDTKESVPVKSEPAEARPQKEYTLQELYNLFMEELSGQENIQECSEYLVTFAQKVTKDLEKGWSRGESDDFRYIFTREDEAPIDSERGDLHYNLVFSKYKHANGHLLFYQVWEWEWNYPSKTLGCIQQQSAWFLANGEDKVKKIDLPSSTLWNGEKLVYLPVKGGLLGLPQNLEARGKDKSAALFSLDDSDGKLVFQELLTNTDEHESDDIYSQMAP
ncbi:MAG: hypothetical protein GY810_10490 [Aureispira sp.]|nr:hypothetical protein [Aureispira sp.]